MAGKGSNVDLMDPDAPVSAGSGNRKRLILAVLLSVIVSGAVCAGATYLLMNNMNASHSEPSAPATTSAAETSSTEYVSGDGTTYGLFPSATVGTLHAEGYEPEIPVVSELNVDTLERGKVHRFFFRAGTSGTNRPYYIPVIVARGAQEGPKLLLNSAIHGDELNGVRIVQKVMGSISVGNLSGTVLAVPGLNQNAMERDARTFYMNTDGGAQDNANRKMPGKENGDTLEQWAFAVWNKLFFPNADFAIDLHTQTRGTAYPMFVFADYRNPDVKDMASNLNADQVKDDAGEDGTVETEFVKRNITAVTFEIGHPKVWNQEQITRAIAGINNFMMSKSMIPGTPAPTKFFDGTGGFTSINVELNQMVKQGEEVAVQYNAFGDPLYQYVAPRAGTILCVATDPLREPDSTVVRVLSKGADAEADAVPNFVELDAAANAKQFTCAKEPCEGPNFMNGYEIVDELDVKTLPAGKAYRFWFRAGTSQADTTYLIPVLVTRGATDPDSKILLVNSGVHGDELNGIRVVQMLFNQSALPPSAITGTIVGIPGINQNGLEHNARNFWMGGEGGWMENANRVFGKSMDEAYSPVEVWAAKIWNQFFLKSLRNGTDDMAVDLHTQSRGTDYPMYVFADYRDPKVQVIAENLNAEQIKIDPGAGGTIETSFVKAGVPAVTFEIGAPKVWQKNYIQRAYDGILNLMANISMIAAAPKTQYPAPVMTNDVRYVKAAKGGFTELKVKLGDKVKEGDVVAIQMNAFGDVIETYKAPATGIINSVATDPLREPGATIVKVNLMNEDPMCKDGCWEGEP